MELFIAADRFGIERLKSMCEQVIITNIDTENAEAILHASDIHNAASLREVALNFILHNFDHDQVSKSAAFEQLS